MMKHSNKEFGDKYNYEITNYDGKESTKYDP